MKRVLMAASLALVGFGLSGGPVGAGVSTIHAAPGAFNGTYTGLLTVTVPPVGFSHPQSFEGNGHTTTLGQSAITGNRDGFDLCDSILSSQDFSNDNFFVLTKNTADSITLEYKIASCDPEAGTFIVAGGTGRFAGAQGTGLYGLSSTLMSSSTDPNTGVETDEYSFRLTVTGSFSNRA